MTVLDTGTLGAKVQSWRRANPRDLLKRLIEGNPKWSKELIFKSFLTQVRDDPDVDYLDSIIEYWFANNYHSLVGPRSRVAGSSAQAIQRRADIEAIKSTIKKRAVQMVLLDIVLPNGKPLRDCTAQDCIKAGGWFAKIARQVKPGEVVGNVLTETQLRKLYHDGSRAM